jgi:membrane-bound ClpP family serine protease
MALFLWFSGLCTFYALSNGILGVIGIILLPLYFSFCGSEAAVRFSLLLCVHSVILACIPNKVVSIFVKKSGNVLILQCAFVKFSRKIFLFFEGF